MQSVILEAISARVVRHKLHYGKPPVILPLTELEWLDFCQVLSAQFVTKNTDLKIEGQLSNPKFDGIPVVCITPRQIPGQS